MRGTIRPIASSALFLWLCGCWLCGCWLCGWWLCGCGGAAEGHRSEHHRDVPHGAETAEPVAQAPTASEVPETGAGEVPSHLTRAVAHPGRTEEDRARDADRRPAEVLAFFGIEPGMRVAEMMAGRGYYSELLAHAVGPDGHVIAHNNPYVLERFAREPLTERLARLPNATLLEGPLDDPGLPEGELDAALMILFYHDTYWMEADRQAMNRAIYRALRPGGVFGVIDHRAAPGAGTGVVRSLHRIEPHIVREEILEAGFELEAESDLLRHPEDDRTQNVFDDAIRGRTDRFIFRFRKPAR